MQIRYLLVTATMAGLSIPALACSPMLISPEDALQAPGPSVRFPRIVLAEVLAARAPARLAELEQWRADVQAVAAEQQRQDALDAEQAKIDAATPRDHNSPPPPPPASRVLEPVLPVAFELRTEVDLFTLETIHGAQQDQFSVAAGGPCGSTPRPGEQVLVFLRQDGLAHLLQRPGVGGSQVFDDAFLDRVRACARGDCEDAAH